MKTSPIRRVRPPKPEELNVDQQTLYQGLPEELRPLFLAQLPPVTTTNAKVKEQKIAALTAHINQLHAEVLQLKNHELRLQEIVRRLQAGEDPTQVNLREALKRPVVSAAKKTRAKAAQEDPEAVREAA